MHITSPLLRRLGVSACALLMIAIGLTVPGCVTGPSAEEAKSLFPPEPQREFRAAWVATVNNIDWPSKPGLSTQEQQKELIAILDKCAALHLNAVVLQVRTSCDAFYPSKLEPWSEYLTGKQGQAPEPMYDPLQMWVEEAHRRGLELHAWLNPYRARVKGAKTPDAPNHVSQTNPDIVKSFNGYEWLDPGEPAAQDLTYDVFMDVVKRYDIDGVHMDDYFYPYSAFLTDEKTKKVSDFPDEPSWDRYVQSGGKLSRGDWRRHNVDQLVERIYKGIKAAKPHVKFGISPFGIARPGNPPTVKSGFNQYDELYANTQLWLREGWCDYFSPQLYWKVDSPQPYRDLVEWWTNENPKGRHIWPGLYLTRIKQSDASWTPRDILDQIDATRWTRGATGHVHFSMIGLMQNRKDVSDQLLNGPYKEQALVPASPWLDNRPPASPHVMAKREGDSDVVDVAWRYSGREPAWLWAVYTKYGSAWRVHVYPADTDHVQVASDPVFGPVNAVAVRAVDRSGNQSPAVKAIKLEPVPANWKPAKTHPEPTTQNAK